MNDLHNNAAANTIHTFSKVANGNEPERATIYTGDIRQPWKAVFGFPTTAARLAMGQELVLHCREDEVIELMERLNELLESPESLGQAYNMLNKLQQQTEQKLARLIALRDQPIAEDEISDLMTDAEQLLAEPQEQTLANRLACILSPNHAVQEIAGTGKMLARLNKQLAALEQVKDEGFHVVVHDKRRALIRSALESRRNEPIATVEQFGAPSAGFLLPPKYHLTLWTYLVARGAAGQSAIWN